jgi:hypothetical protein
MKRSSLLLFALVLLILSFTGSRASGQLLAGTSVVQLTDNDGNGYANVGDAIRVRVGFQNNVIVADANLSAIGLSANYPMVQNGNFYDTGLIQLDTFRASPVYTSQIFTVRGYDATALVWNYENTNPVIFDLVQVSGAGATATRSGNTITLSITDNAYQGLPNPGTVARVDLTPVGGANNAQMQYVGGNVFTLNYTVPANTDYAGPFTISLDDPAAGHPAVSYQTAPLTVDNIYPAIDGANTTVTILSGNTTALPGDILRITARVTAYDGDRVWASAPALIGGAAPALNGGVQLNLITSSGPGNPAEWQLDVVLSEFNFKTTSLPVTFSFLDNAGNLSMVTRTIAIDLDRPNILSSRVNIYLDNGALSSLADIATTSCRLEFISTITVDIQPDPNTVTIDLSPIGGPSNYPMTQIGLSDQYRAVYDIPQGTLEDGASHIFIVSARDNAGNAVAQATTPAIRIDNNPPILTGAQLSAPTAGILVGTVFTIQCNAQGLENGSVTVNLSAIGLGAAENLPAVGGNVYRRTFTLPDSRAPGVPGVVDGFTSFTVSANDTVTGTILGHLVQTNTNQMMVDNEPSTILGSGSHYSHNLFPTDDDGFTRIGDTLSFHVRVASDPINVRLNLLALGFSSSESMIASAAPSDGQLGWYDYVITGGIATGTINRLAGMPFTVTATDDAGNATTTQILVNMDNKPVEVTGFVVDISYKAGRIDNDPSIINLNKSLRLRVPIAVPVPDDHAPTALIDLSAIGGSASTVMNYNSGSYSTDITDTAQTLFDSTGYRFQAVISDLSGNRTLAQSSLYRVDCNPPTIVSATVEQLTGGAAAIVGDRLRFRAQLTNNESTAPTIDLTNIGGSSNQAMTATGGGWYEYTATVAAGTIDRVSTSWTVTAWDNDQNYIEATTNNIDLDNYGPQLNGALTLLINGNPVTALSTIKIGDTLDFTVDIDNAAGTEGPATIDLRPVGGIASAVMTFDAGLTTYSLSFTAAQALSEYANYRFRAYIDDISANRVTAQSAIVPVIDCQPVAFSNSGITIWQTNNDNPATDIDNIGDVLMVYTTAANYTDSIASATIGSGTVDFATATMVFNAARNRHEALFTVQTPGMGGWGTLTGSTDRVYFKLSGIDDATNLTATAEQPATFTIRNVLPELDLANTSITLVPNRYRDLSGGIPVYNLGTDTVGDRLVASITFADSLPMHRAWLDFSELGSGTFELSVSGNQAETSAAGSGAKDFLPRTGTRNASISKPWTKPAIFQ